MKDSVSFSSLSLPLQNWLKAQLRGAAVAFPAAVSPDEIARLIQFSAQARLHPVLFSRHQQAAQSGNGEYAHPPELAREWQLGYVSARYVSHLRESELQRILQCFARQGIAVLVLKGTALARWLYPETALRLSSDMDLLVPVHQRRQAETVLLELGYQRGTKYSYEIAYHLTTANITHVIDLHWKISDSSFLSETQPFDELHARALPLTGLPPNARRLNSVDALLHACTHLAKDQQWDEFIWLMDIDLLWRQMTPAEQVEFARLAEAKDCRLLCRAALQRAREILALPLSEADFPALPPGTENSAFLLNPHRDVLIDYQQSWRVSSWRMRLAIIRRALFPPLSAIHPDHKTGKHNHRIFIYLRRLIRLPQRVFRLYRQRLAASASAQAHL